MSRWMISLLLAGLGTAGCAATRPAPASSTTPYGANVTYTMSAAALAELAKTGQDWKLNFSVETGSSAQSTHSCTAVPVPPTPTAQRLVLLR
jgi:hypothetical protein